MKKIVLFDMDGTLTPPRKRMGWGILNALTDLQSKDFEIGIVTGSDMDYVKQQLDIVFDVSPLDPFKLHYLPCNGTKYFKMQQDGFKSIYENDMRENLNESAWRRLIQLLTSLQSSITRVHRNIPMTGNFINYRGSMINWCPIGRQATEKDRMEWCLWDKRQNIRNNWLTIARQGLNNADLEHIIIKMGGDTSFDIYPDGWDKTFAFRNFKDYDKVYFVGDRCTLHGNDREAYLAAGDLGHSTTGPEETIKIINNIIKGELNE
jgi:phosphomannomutase